MDNKQLQIIKKEILHYLTDDFENNQAIFEKKKVGKYLMVQI